MKKLTHILILLLFAIAWQTATAQQNVGQEDMYVSPQKVYSSLSAAEKKEVREKYFDEFLDVEMFLDVIAARRFNYVDDNSMAGQFGNRKLRQTIDYFKAKTKTGIGVFCRIDKEHFWVRGMSSKGYLGNHDTTGSEYNILFDIKLIPLSSSNGYQAVITYSTGIGIKADEYNDKYIKEPNLTVFKTYMSDSLPTLQSSEFIAKLNDKIVTALLKLLGQDMPPITVKLVPKDANGYDNYPAPLINEKYEQVPIHGKPEIIYWASIPQGQSLQIQSTTSEAIKDSITKPLQLKKNESIQQKFSSKDSAKEFTVSGFSKGDNTVKAVYQVAEGKGVDIIAGQLNVAAYKEEKLKLTIVPITGITFTQKEQLQTELNNIFKQAVVEFEITVDAQFNYTKGIHINPESNSQNPYDDSMKEVIAQYKKTNTYSRKTRYIFLIDQFASGSSSDIGYMPFYNQFGFLKSVDARKLARWIAHELGHGAFGLTHTNELKLLPLDNANLMDYGDSTRLCKFQWDIIHDSDAGNADFDSASEAMGMEMLVDIDNEIDYVSPASTTKGVFYLNDSQYTVIFRKEVSNFSNGKFTCEGVEYDIAVGSKSDKFSAFLESPKFADVIKKLGKNGLNEADIQNESIRKFTDYTLIERKLGAKQLELKNALLKKHNSDKVNEIIWLMASMQEKSYENLFSMNTNATCVFTLNDPSKIYTDECLELLIQKLKEASGFGLYELQVVINPQNEISNIHQEAFPMLNTEGQTIGFLLPDDVFFIWIDDGKNVGFFKNGELGSKNTYTSYIEDKINRKEQPISWGMYKSTRDMGDLILSFIDSPVETSEGIAKGIKKIVTLAFDIEKTWNTILNADATDVSYIAAMIAVGYVSLPGKAGMLGTNDFAKFGKYVKDNFTILQSSKTSWKKVLEIFAKGGAKVEDFINKRVVKTGYSYDNELGKLVEYQKYNNVALGKKAGNTLKGFGDKVGANVWTSETDKIFTKMYDLPESWSFERSMTSVLNETIEINQGKILFDINGVEIQKAVLGDLIYSTELVMRGSITEFELQMILRNKAWYDNIIFHERGIVLSNQEIIIKGLKYLGN